MVVCKPGDVVGVVRTVQQSAKDTVVEGYGTPEMVCTLVRAVQGVVPLDFALLLVVLLSRAETVVDKLWAVVVVQRVFELVELVDIAAVVQGFVSVQSADCRQVAVVVPRTVVAAAAAVVQVGAAQKLCAVVSAVSVGVVASAVRPMVVVVAVGDNIPGVGCSVVVLLLFPMVLLQQLQRGVAVVVGVGGSVLRDGIPAWAENEVES